MGMIMQNGKQYGPVYSERPPRKWLINPSVMDEIFNAPRTAFDYAYIPYTHKAQNNRNDQYFKVNDRSTFNGVPYVCTVRMYGNGVGALAIADKIEAGIYSKLVAYTEVTTANYADWVKSHITLMTSPQFQSDATPNPDYIIRDIALADIDKTAEQIMSQPGVEINITDNLLVPTQYVKIDISNITQDFYVCAWNCDRTLSFRSLYLE